MDFTFSDALRKHLARAGFDTLVGTGPMQRLIQDTLRRALADELLFGRLVDGGRVSVDIDEAAEKDRIKLDITPPEPRPKKKEADGAEALRS